MSFICDECGTNDCDNCTEKDEQDKYMMFLNDGSKVTSLSYMPNVGEIIKLDDVDKWYKVTHVSDHQNWCTCRELDNPIF